MEATLTSPLPMYYDIEVPPSEVPPSGKRSRKRWPVLIGTHGYEGNKESMMRLVLRVVAGKMIGASLQGPYQGPVQGPAQGPAGSWLPSARPPGTVGRRGPR